MKHKYELFEKCPDGLSLWRDSVLGFQLTRRRLQVLAQISENQYYAIDLTTGEVLAFISKRAMLMDSEHFQKLKNEARAMLLRYSRYGGGILGEDQGFVCSPKWVN
jgi:hypothetical protein